MMDNHENSEQHSVRNDFVSGHSVKTVGNVLRNLGIIFSTLAAVCCWFISNAYSQSWRHSS